MAKGVASAITVLFLAILFLVPPSEANIIRVPEDVPTIQEGLNIAGSGDTVLVSHGTYYENIVWPGTPGIKLFANEQAPPESTIIEPAALHMPVISITTPVDTTTVIRGFVIKNSIADEGAAIYCNGASPTIGDAVCGNHFEGNIATGYGGAIQCKSSSARIMFNKFVDDSATYGGAISCAMGCTVTIANNKIERCRADQGGGIYSVDNDFIIANSIISCEGEGAALYLTGTAIATGNTIDSNIGRAVYCAGSVQILSNNITNNTGGGIYVESGSDVTIEHNTIEHNSAMDGPAIFCRTATPTIRYNKIRYNTIEIAPMQGYIPGAIYVEGGVPTIEHNTITHNEFSAGISICDAGGSLSYNYLCHNNTGAFT